MNLYVRLFLMFMRARFKGSISIFDEFISTHRVLPNDLDLLGHMNNGRYFTITDYVRIEMLIRAGIWEAMKKRNVYPVMAGETIQFRKSLKPFQKYEILSKTLGWDNKFFYVEHRFISRKELYALMLVKVRVIGAGSIRVSPSDVLRYVYPNNIKDININEPIASWSDSAQIHWKKDKQWQINRDAA